MELAQGITLIAATSFEARWARWNIARAAFSTAAFAFLTWALVLFGGS